MSALPIISNSCQHSLASQVTCCQGTKSEVVLPSDKSLPGLHLKLPKSQSTHSITTFPAILTEQQSTGAPIEYPSSNKTGVIRTYASYRQQPIPELVQQAHASWMLNLSIPVPKDAYNPTLHSLIYVIKYATTFDNGDSTVQTDLVISPKASIAEGIISDAPGTGFHRTTQSIGYSPQIVDEEVATSLSSVLGIKSNAGSATWSHYIDHQRLYPNIRLLGYPNTDGSPTKVYLNFHVCEYPTAQTHRSLAIEVSATWSEDSEARKAAEAAQAEKARKEEEARKAAEEAEKKKAEEELKKKIDAEVDAKVAQAEQRLKDDADKRIQVEVKAAEDKIRAEMAALSYKAPDGSTADDKVQKLIGEKLKEKGIEPCSAGLAYVRNDAKREYRCTGGSHAISFDDLGI